MKLDWIKSLIVVCLTALIAYGFYEFANEESNKLLLSIGSFLLISTTAVFSFGVNLNEPRIGMMFKTLSIVWFFLVIVENFIFSFFNFSIPLYIILNGITILLYAIIAVSIYRTQHQNLLDSVLLSDAEFCLFDYNMNIRLIDIMRS